MSEPAGTALVVLATLGHPDREGDLIVAGSLANRPDQLAAVSSDGHAVILGAEEPVGSARVFERDGRLMAEVLYYA